MTEAKEAMTDDLDLVRRINEACNGHPHAKIPWPHRLLHDARDCLTALLDEIAALKREVGDAKKEAETARVWPDWARQIHLLLKRYGCDIEDDEGVELPQALADWLEGYRDTAEASRDALAGKMKEVAEIAALMDRLGGLGYENHARLKRIATIAETPAEQQFRKAQESVAAMEPWRREEVRQEMGIKRSAEK